MVDLNNCSTPHSKGARGMFEKAYPDSEKYFFQSLILPALKSMFQIPIQIRPANA